MKSLTVFLFAIVSLNVFSAEVGEDKKGECIYADQSNKRDAKVVEAPASQEAKKVETKTKSK